MNTMLICCLKLPEQAQTAFNTSASRNSKCQNTHSIHVTILPFKNKKKSTLWKNKYYCLHVNTQACNTAKATVLTSMIVCWPGCQAFLKFPSKWGFFQTYMGCQVGRHSQKLVPETVLGSKGNQRDICHISC